VRWIAPRAGQCVLEPFMPLDFAGVVLCIGPVNVEWPDEGTLRAATCPVRLAGGLGALWFRLRADRRKFFSAIALAVATLAATGWLATAHSADDARPQLTAAQARDALQHALDATPAAHRLEVKLANDTLMVQGLVDDAAQADAARAVIAHEQPGFAVAQRISVAPEVAESIREALGLPGVQVSYRGHGVFSLAARTDDVEGTRASVQRVAADLAPLVQRIDTVFDEAPAAPARTPDVSSTLTVDGLAVTETRNGVKNLVLSEPAPDDAAPGPTPAASEPPTRR